MTEVARLFVYHSSYNYLTQGLKGTIAQFVHFLAEETYPTHFMTRADGPLPGHE